MAPWSVGGRRFAGRLVAGLLVAVALSAVSSGRGAAVAKAAERAVDAAQRVRFNRDVRPILASRCFQCHGPDDKKRDGGLRLDVREAAIADRGGSAAVAPGAPERSEILRRIRSHDPDEQMPPPSAKKPPLDAAQIATLERWIAEGAEYEAHWAFLPLGDSPPPAVRDVEWPKNSIDSFVLRRLEDSALRPSEEAERAILLRRLSLDLLGVVPSPEEVEAAVADDAPDAVERLVDRMLASPHYGERWGRHWLDQARYADSHGYTIDGERTQWPFRDWVIRALNRDVGFDQFTIEQLAGDRLPQATKEQRIASAFHRNTLINQEGGTDAEQFRNESVVDRVNTTGAVWLGLTVGCAQCHSHKFDPLSQREYYELFAFFNQGSDANNKGASLAVVRGELFDAPTIDLSPAGPAARLAQKQADWERARLERLIAERTAAQAARGEPAESAKPEWRPLEYVRRETSAGVELKRLDDNSLLNSAPTADKASYLLIGKASGARIAAIRLRTLTHDSLPKTGPGSASNGNFVLSELEVEADGKPVALAAATADHEQPGYPVAAAIDGKADTGWAINVGQGSTAKMNANHEATFVLSKPLDLADRPLTVRLKHEVNAGYLIGRFELSTSETAPSVPVDGASAALLAALEAPAAKRTEAQRKAIQAAFWSAALLAALEAPAAKRTEAQRKAIQAAFWADDPASAAEARELARREAAGEKADVMVMQDRPEQRPTFVLTRGDFLRPDRDAGAVAPNVPQAVQAAFPAPSGPFVDRADLARWLVSPHNPLTPRVAVNRVWMRYFGKGLVETEEDFGTQGTPPSHPELLDRLGLDWIRSGWSFKALHRRIATSAVYRQDSRSRADLTGADPLNVLLGRQNRLRVEGEVVRDAALAASGLWVRSIGGPSVKPPQPDGVYAFTQSRKSWTAAEGEDRFRRGMYTFFYRSAPYPLLTTFDSPDFQTACTRRVRSNTPLQSLTLANDPAFLEIARGLSGRTLRETEPPSGSSLDLTSARLRRLFVAALGRTPDERERAVIAGFYDELMRELASDPATVDAWKPLDAPPGDAQAGAALTGIARALFNTDAFITRE